MSISVHRIYDRGPQPAGYRVLVDRVWPRGITRERARLDGWFRDLAPSTALRTWFGHDPARWREFRTRYQAELARRPEDLERLRQFARDGHLLLLYGARDVEHNQARVIRDVLEAGPSAAPGGERRKGVRRAGEPRAQ